MDRLYGPDVALWARVEWRTRWRSYLLLAGVIGVTVGVMLAALTAADRSETAFARLRSATRATDMTVYSGDAAKDPAAAVASAKSIDGVASAGVETQLAVRPVGVDLVPYYDLYVSAADPSGVNSPLIVSGRALNPANPSEVVLSERFAAQLGVKVGDPLPLESATTKWLNVSNSGADPGPLDGPQISATVVGIARSPADFAKFRAVMHLSPSFVTKYGSQVDMRSNVEAKLSDTALHSIATGNNPFQSLGGVDFSPYGDSSATVAALGTIANALRFVGAAATLAGVAAVVIVLLRIVAVTAPDSKTFTALGWTRSRHEQAVVIGAIPWLIIGVLVGLVAGAGLSPHAMASLARRIDPSSNSVIMKTSLVLIVACGAAILSFIVLLASLRVMRSRDREEHSFGARSGGVHRPLSVSLGFRQALFGRAERGGRASRGALAAVTVGVVGAVAALVVGASISRLEKTPRLSGQHLERAIGGENLMSFVKASSVLADDNRVAEFAQIHVSDSFQVDGIAPNGVLIYETRRGDPPLTLLRGRLAQQADEVTFGPTTLSRLHKAVGDEVQLEGWKCLDEGACAEVYRQFDGNERLQKLREIQVPTHRTFRIVGEILLPEGDFHHDEGMALTVSAADSIVGNILDDWNSYLHFVAFDWAKGIDAVAADATMKAAGFAVMVESKELNPAVVTNLARVTNLPALLAVFLGALAFVSLAHALAVSVRLRAHESATLRALGMTSGSAAGIVTAQTFVLVVVALLIGVPVGYALGAQIWRPIATRANVVVSVTLPWSSIGILCAIALAGATMVAVVAGWRVRQQRPAPLLRTG